MYFKRKYNLSKHAFLVLTFLYVFYYLKFFPIIPILTHEADEEVISPESLVSSGTCPNLSQECLKPSFGSYQDSCTYDIVFFSQFRETKMTQINKYFWRCQIWS